MILKILMLKVPLQRVVLYYITIQQKRTWKNLKINFKVIKYIFFYKYDIFPTIYLYDPFLLWTAPRSLVGAAQRYFGALPEQKQNKSNMLLLTATVQFLKSNKWTRPGIDLGHQIEFAINKAKSCRFLFFTALALVILYFLYLKITSI